MRAAMHLATLCLMIEAVLRPAAAASAAPARQEAVSTSAIAYQPFQHGFMLWREDVDKITVGYLDIPTKQNMPCSEVYRDTFDGQPYDLPSTPAGLTNLTLGFGWLYKNDPELAQHLGYATAEEVSRVADIQTVGSEGGRAITVTIGDPLPGVTGPLTISDPDEAGLSYCFPRRNENRGGFNTWISRQLFEHGAMVWRQDMQDRIEVWHYDTIGTPRIACGDTLNDTWRPGMDLAFGDLEVPDKPLPQKGFGRAWLDNEYIRTSLGYPTSGEEGGFAEISYETRGSRVLRHMTAHLTSGEDWTTTIEIPDATGPEADRRLNMGCRTRLAPH